MEIIDTKYPPDSDTQNLKYNDNLNDTNPKMSNTVLRISEPDNETTETMPHQVIKLKEPMGMAPHALMSPYGTHPRTGISPLDVPKRFHQLATFKWIPADLPFVSSYKLKIDYKFLRKVFALSTFHQQMYKGITVQPTIIIKRVATRLHQGRALLTYQNSPVDYIENPRDYHDHSKARRVYQTDHVEFDADAPGDMIIVPPIEHFYNMLPTRELTTMIPILEDASVYNMTYGFLDIYPVTRLRTMSRKDYIDFEVLVSFGEYKGHYMNTVDTTL